VGRVTRICELDVTDDDPEVGVISKELTETPWIFMRAKDKDEGKPWLISIIILH
tara:strand:+ start:323 stop:484 length:162 start_codon:yes stop_codon:yes gene_type:complete